MDNYKDKYLKYKNKYLKLKNNMVGGDNKKFTIDFSKFKLLFLGLIGKEKDKQINVEFQFNIIIHNDIQYIMIKKGTPITENYEVPINDPITFGYITGHTHPREICYYTDCALPSARDYDFIYQNYYKYFLKLHFIATYDGIWFIKVNNKLYLDKDNPDESEHLDNIEKVRFIEGFPLINKVECILNDIKNKMEPLHIKYNEILLNIEKEKLDDTSKKKKVIECYIHEIKNIGFDIEFIFWEDQNKLEKIEIEVDEQECKYVNYYNFALDDNMFTVEEVQDDHDNLVQFLIREPRALGYNQYLRK